MFEIRLLFGILSFKKNKENKKPKLEYLKT